jgi:hypothetical protein
LLLSLFSCLFDNNHIHQHNKASQSNCYANKQQYNNIIEHKDSIKSANNVSNYYIDYIVNNFTSEFIPGNYIIYLLSSLHTLVSRALINDIATRWINYIIHDIPVFSQFSSMVIILIIDTGKKVKEILFFFCILAPVWCQSAFTLFWL